MSEKSMQGVYPIRVDVESMQKLIDFNIESGVHGLGVALGSEVFKLSEAERVQVTRTVVDQTRGRVPVVINTGAAGTDLALLYSHMAEENGADSLMVMPPSFMPVEAGDVREYFKAISDAVDLPIFIQDTAHAHVSAGLAHQIAEESEHVRYVKVESPPTPIKVAEAVAGAGDLMTIFGGGGGNYFIEEMRRGSVGTMPGCSQPEAFVEVWDLFHKGDESGARAAFEGKILPMNRISAQSWGAFYHVNKELLRQRGVIRTAVVRGPIAPFPDLARRELQELIDELYA